VHPESGHAAISVVNAQRELTQVEILRAVLTVGAFSGSSERRRDPTSLIEVLDCFLESL
jgi:hypothetical protein